MIEVKEIVVETCDKLVNHYADKHETKNTDIRIRIDVDKIGNKPVFGIFNDSTIVERSSLKEIIKAGGAKGFSMILGVYIRNIIKDIFVESLKQLELDNPKRIFLLLYLHKNKEGVTSPNIALYMDGEYLWALPISEVMDATMQQVKK